MKVVSCPGCLSDQARSTGPKVAGFSVRAGNKEFHQDAYAVLECIRCGLLYKTQCLASDELSEYYSQTDFTRWDIPALYPTERAALDILRTLPKGSTILDFGCSSGRFLSRLNLNYRTFGYDLNHRATSEAKAKGLTVLTKEEFDSTQNDSFNAIVLVDVFEHLLDPTSVLEKLISMVSKNGLLIIVTGDGDNVFCRRGPAEFWYFRNVEHVIMLTRRYGENIAEQFRLRISGWQLKTHYDVSLWRKYIQLTQHFVFWQFRQKKKLSTMLLNCVPGVRKAQRWPVAPAFSSGKDHVIAVFRK